MPELHARAYRDLRGRVLALVGDAGEAVMARVSPATPEWTVHDLLAHLVGVTDDVVHGRLEGVATDPWTARQVEARRAVATAALLDEWDARAAAFEEMLASAPAEITGQAVFDAATHEHDLRHALGAPGARESDAVAIAWSWLVDARGRRGTAAIRCVTEAGEVVAGVGDPAATVEASRFELLRASTGRRSASEIATYRWDPAPDPQLVLAAPIFRLRDEPLGE